MAYVNYLRFAKYLGNSNNLNNIDGWQAENRWTNPTQNDVEGIFNGIDYMLFHNLYRLIYKNQITTPYEEDYYCSCNSVPQANQNTNTAQEAIAKNNLNQKATYLNNCQANVFAPVQNVVSNTVFNVNQHFNEYNAIGIQVPKYMKENVLISNSGSVNLNTSLINCQNTLTIQPGSTLTLYNKSKYVQNAPASVTDNSGDIVINSGTIFHVKASQSRLILRGGSKLIIEDGGKLIIDYGARIEFYNGAQIITYGNNSEIILRGGIKLMDQTTFEINHMNSPNSGRIIFEGTPGLTAQQANSKFKFRGKNITDEFVVLKPNTKIQVQDANIIELTISNCLINFHLNNKIEAYQPIILNQVRFTGNANNFGVEITDQNSITSCQFYDVPLTAKLHIENTAKLNVSMSKFYRQNTANVSGNPYLIYVEGKGYTLQSCEFSNAQNYCIQSKNMIHPSEIKNCTFQGNPTGAFGLEDNSTTEIIIKNSSFTNLYLGAYKISGKLSLKCNQFNNQAQVNVAVYGGCTLNMSGDNMGGYNTLNNTSSGSNIIMGNAYINLMNGYNFIDSRSNPIISGTTAQICMSGTSCSIFAPNNQWNANNTTVHPSRFQLFTALGNTSVSVNTANAMTKPSCGFYDPIIPIEPLPINPRSLILEDSLMPIVSTLTGDSIRLVDYFNHGMLRMELVDSLGNDLDAIDIFGHIFDQNLSKTEVISGKYLSLALQNMKNAYENAYSNGKIALNKQSTAYDPYTQKYVNALMYMTDSFVDSVNYAKQFYNEINKAHLFRMFGKSDIGLNMLEELESCGLDSTEQQHLNYWKQQYLIDFVVNDIGFESLDTTIVVDTTDFIEPESLPVNALAFGSVIYDMNNILYPNCDYYTKEMELDLFRSFSVYPNPTDNMVSVYIDIADENGSLYVMTLEGKILQKRITDSQVNNYQLHLGSYQSGIYLIQYRSDSGKLRSAKVVLN